MPYTTGALSLPFIANSETSLDAAIAAQAFAPTQLQRYLAWMEGRGEQGGTDREAHAALGIERSFLCCRRAEAMRQGLVAKTDQRRGGCAVYRSLQE